MVKAKELFDIDKLREHTLKAIKEHDAYKTGSYGIDETEGNYKTVLVCDLVSGALGIHQPKTIAEIFGGKVDENDDDVYYYLEGLYTPIEKELTKLVGLDGFFFFGWYDADDSFSLFFYHEYNKEDE